MRFPKAYHLRLMIEDAAYYRTSQLDSSLEKLKAVVLRPIPEAGARLQGLLDFTIFLETAMLILIGEKADKEGLLCRSHNARRNMQVGYPFTTDTLDKREQRGAWYRI